MFEGVFFGVSYEEDLIAHGLGEGLGHPLVGDDGVPEALMDLFAAVFVGEVVSPSDVGAVVASLACPIGEVVTEEGAGPELVDIDVEAVVHHVGAEAAGRSQVDFEGAEFEVGELEGFDVEEALFEFVGLDDLAADVEEFLGWLSQGVVVDGAAVAHDLHDAAVDPCAVFEEYAAVAIDEAVVAHEGALEELLCDEGAGPVLLEGVELFVAVDALGADGADAEVWLDDDGVARGLGEGVELLEVGGPCSCGAGDARLLEDLSHAGFAAAALEVFGFEAFDVEVPAELGFDAQPVFVERVDAIDFAVAVGEESHGALHGVELEHVGDRDVIGEAFAQGVAEAVGGGVADAEYGGAVIGEVSAEAFEVRGEVGGDEDDLHGGALGSLY